MDRSFLDQRRVADLLKTLRERSGLTYGEIAAKANVSTGTVSNYFTGVGHKRDPKIIRSLLKAINVEGGPVYDDVMSLLGFEDQGDRKFVGSIADRALAGCERWDVADFGPNEANVRAAVGNRSPGPLLAFRQATLTRYVSRAHDLTLRNHVEHAQQSLEPRLTVLVGRSSTGKSRSLYEAVHHLCQDWQVIRPFDASALRGLVGNPSLRRPTVIWLDHLEDYFDVKGLGLDQELLVQLRESCTSGLVVVGSIWVSKLNDLPRRPGNNPWRSAMKLLEDDSITSQISVPDSLTTDRERMIAKHAGAEDSRLTKALLDRDGFGFAQVLSGAKELLTAYERAPRHAQMVVEAAADARRIGLRMPVPAELLRELAFSSWHREKANREPPHDWFESALEYVTASLDHESGDTGIACLFSWSTVDSDEPAGNSSRNSRGYQIADFLEQHLIDKRRNLPILDDWWDALGRHVDDHVDYFQLISAAQLRGRFDVADRLLGELRSHGRRSLSLDRTEEGITRRRRTGRSYQRLLEMRRHSDMSPIAFDRFWQAALPQEVELSTHSPSAEHSITQLAEQSLREAIELGEPMARTRLAEFLGAAPEAEQAWRDAITAGEPDAQFGLAQWLDDRPNRPFDADAAWQVLAQSVDDAWTTRAEGLMRKHAPSRRVVVALYAAADAGEAGSWSTLARFMARLLDSEQEVVEAWANAIENSEPGRTKRSSILA